MKVRHIVEFDMQTGRYIVACGFLFTGQEETPANAPNCKSCLRARANELYAAGKYKEYERFRKTWMDGG